MRAKEKAIEKDKQLIICGNDTKKKKRYVIKSVLIKQMKG